MEQLIKVLTIFKFYEGENKRSVGFSSGYRPLFSFPNTNTKISGRFELINMDKIEPGTTSIVIVTFIKGILSSESFRIGERFTISEDGINDLGEGEILERFAD